MITQSYPVWLEGQLIRPQHFQQLNRAVMSHINDSRQRCTEFEWGFEVLHLNLDHMDCGKIGITSCRGIFPDGTLFDLPSSGQCPNFYELPENRVEATLYLCIPIQKANQIEMSSNIEASSQIRYTIYSEEIQDCCEEDADLAPIEVAKLNCTILSHHDDLSNMITLPFAKIKQIDNTHKITLSTTYIPPLTNFKNNPNLLSQFNSTGALLEKQHQRLAQRLTDTRQAGSTEIIDFMLLQLFNRYRPHFTSFKHKPSAHPMYLFEILISLQSELSTFLNERYLVEIPHYQHNNLYACLETCFQQLKHALSLALKQHANTILLQSKPHGLYTATLEPGMLKKGTLFVLSAQASMPLDKLTKILQSHTKIAALNQIQNLVHKGLSGLPLQTLPIAPRQIPFQANCVYVSINTDHPMWKEVEDTKEIGLHIGTALENLKLEFWFIQGVQS